MWADLAGWWGWTAQPAPLTEVVAGRIPSPDVVPDGSAPLRWAWAVWMHAAAIPATWVLLPAARVSPTPVRQLLYGSTWVLQDPARSFLAALIVVPVIAMWIAF